MTAPVAYSEEARGRLQFAVRKASAPVVRQLVRVAGHWHLQPDGPR